MLLLFWYYYALTKKQKLILKLFYLQKVDEECVIKYILANNKNEIH